MEGVSRENLTGHPARWWHALPDGRIQCDLCPRDCRLREGQRGACFVRGMQDGKMLLTTYGRSSGVCVDPIEKKPLNHFRPGSSTLSFGTAGCNLACKFCQNWDISRSRDMDRIQEEASPELIAFSAKELGAQSVSFTYNDPIIFAEYAMDCPDACHARGIQTVAVTAGYLYEAPRREFFAKMDAANVDLKAFTDDFYIDLCGGRLSPVLDTLTHIVHETSCWLEITTLLIPGKNDSSAEIEALAQWCFRELGPDVPLHFSAFHPAWKMMDAAQTPLDTLERARRIAMDAGMRYVYLGNVHHKEGDASWCHGCGKAVIQRDWFFVLDYALDEQGCCPHCKTPIPGRFGKFESPFGAQRMPVRL